LLLLLLFTITAMIVIISHGMHWWTVVTSEVKVVPLNNSLIYDVH